MVSAAGRVAGGMPAALPFWRAFMEETIRLSMKEYVIASFTEQGAASLLQAWHRPQHGAVNGKVTSAATRAGRHCSL